MRLVSFDVGLRNLAVCIMDGTNRSNLKIKYWDLIDVMAESAGHDKAKCFKCKKPANWKKHSEEVFSCGAHKPKTGKPPTKSALNKKTLEELKVEASSHNLGGSTKKDCVNALYDHYRKNVWERCVQSIKNTSVVDLAEPIAKCLEARRNVWRDADLIAFEQQPDKRMLCVQGMMHMWFVSAGFKCKGVSATHKLTNIITVEDATKTYKGRKKTGIVHAAQLVPAGWKDYMMKHPKKDDLADCFLQGLWVMENTKI